MVNIADLINVAIENGYNEEMAVAKASQDVILLMFSKSRFNRNVTIKGGVVMRTISNDARRATVDIDLDLIKYPLTIKGIKELIKELNGIEGVKIKIVGKVEDLKHQDYNGKRVFLDIKDKFNNSLKSKVDIGVHKFLSIHQDEYCFDISSSEEGTSLLINSKEQMFTEKLKSLLRFGYLSTRFKDVYDLFYLCDFVDIKELKHRFDVLIFDDQKMREKSITQIVERVKNIFANEIYLKNLNTSNKNWISIKNEIVLDKIIRFLEYIS